jgi:RNA polymerase sigma-70 factor (ECF subfamily)
MARQRWAGPEVLRIDSRGVTTLGFEAMTVPLKSPSAAMSWPGAPSVSATPEPAVHAKATAASPRQGERLEGWFRDHFDTLWRLAARLGVPLAHVDDVVQEAFIIADRRAAEIAPGSERGFLIGTVVRASANQRRKQKIRLDYAVSLSRQPSPSAPADAEELLAQKQLRQLLDVALDELPEEQRSVLVLHEIEGFSAAQIGELLELRVGTVASRLARARTKFTKAAARLRAKWPEHR